VRGEHPLSLYSSTSSAPVPLPPVRFPPVCLRPSIAPPVGIVSSNAAAAVDNEIDVGLMDGFADPCQPPSVEAADGASESADGLYRQFLLIQDIVPLSPLWVPVGVAVDNEIDFGLMDVFADLAGQPPSVEAAVGASESADGLERQSPLLTQDIVPLSPLWVPLLVAVDNEEIYVGRPIMNDFADPNPPLSAKADELSREVDERRFPETQEQKNILSVLQQCAQAPPAPASLTLTPWKQLVPIPQYSCVTFT
jgi:hypothetical protein